MRTSPRILACGLALALLGFGAHAFAFECPEPQGASPFELKETKQQQRQLSQLLATGDLENRLGEIIAGLRKRHPDAPRYEIVNYLVGAYCPVVKAMPDVSDAAKTQKIAQFAETAFDLIANQQL